MPDASRFVIVAESATLVAVTHKRRRVDHAAVAAAFVGIAATAATAGGGLEAAGELSDCDAGGGCASIDAAFSRLWALGPFVLPLM